MNTSINTIFENIAEAGMVSPTTLNGLPGMSSLEIAEITGKRHDHVLRDIAKMLTELGTFSAPKSGEANFVEAKYQDAQGKPRPLTILNKELTFTLLSRYSFTLSNLIVKRWLALEGSGFERVTVQAAVVHLVEREKDNFREAMKAFGRRTPKKLTAEQKLIQKYQRQANAEARKAHMSGREGI